MSIQCELIREVSEKKNLFS